MHVICNAHDAAILDIEVDRPLWHPCFSISTKNNDRWLSVHFSRSQFPRNRPLIIISKVGCLADWPKEAICYLQTSIGRDQFAKPIPVATIKPFDILAKKRRH